MTSGPPPDSIHQRPVDVGDDTVAAVGRLTEALEMVNEARGLLYAFHRLTGSADFALGDAARRLREAGHHDSADLIDDELVGRNVIEGRWTFQIVEEYDAGYWQAISDIEERIRGELVRGRTHIQEAELKERRRTHGRRHHEATPDRLPESP